MEYGEKVPMDIMDPQWNHIDPKTVNVTSGNTKIFVYTKDGCIKGTGVGKAKGLISDETGAETPFEVEVVKAQNWVEAKGKAASVKLSKLKKKAQKVKAAKTVKFKHKGQGKIKYKLVSAKKGKKSFKKYFKVNSKTGLLTIKKNNNMKKGAYKVTVKVKALGNKNYVASAFEKVTFKIKVK